MYIVNAYYEAGWVWLHDYATLVLSIYLHLKVLMNLAIYSIFQGGAYMHVQRPILVHECALYNGLITGLLLLLP